MCHKGHVWRQIGMIPHESRHQQFDLSAFILCEIACFYFWNFQYPKLCTVNICQYIWDWTSIHTLWFWGWLGHQGLLLIQAMFWQTSAAKRSPFQPAEHHTTAKLSVWARGRVIHGRFKRLLTWFKSAVWGTSKCLITHWPGHQNHFYRDDMVWYMTLDAWFIFHDILYYIHTICIWYDMLYDMWCDMWCDVIWLPASYNKTWHGWEQAQIPYHPDRYCKGCIVSRSHWKGFQISLHSRENPQETMVLECY